MRGLRSSEEAGMTPFYADDWLTIYGGDCRTVLSELPADSVDCVVTSPPYWGLRDYGTATWVDGDEGCDHKQATARNDGGRVNIGGFHGSAREDSDKGAMNFRDTCGKCGATRIDSQLGLERTPEEYVANMVEVFREVRRVLKPSGTCWLNLGDSYFGTGRGPSNDHKPAGLHSNVTERGEFPMKGIYTHDTLKGKDLVGIPWRVAFALQADGWYLRSDIIWSKPNPMPESVTDRPTKSHEYLFLLTKSARYYFDADAVRESAIYEGVTVKASNPDTAKNGAKGKYGATAFGFTQHDTTVSGRNIRSVWNIATRPYPGAHFAVFPPELPERCIKAGSSERGVCGICGAPFQRITVRVTHFAGGSGKAGRTVNASGKWAGIQYGKNLKLGPVNSIETTGWERTCPHDTEPHPAVVLDPFGGSGTVGMVANRLSRRAILIDLNPEYLKQQMTRNAQTPLGLGA